MVLVRAALVLLAVAGLRASDLPQGPAPVPTTEFKSTLPVFDKTREEHLRAWLKAADDHDCGVADRPAQTIAAWPSVQITDTRTDYLEFILVLNDLRREIQEKQTETAAQYRGRRWSRADMEKLLGLTPKEAATTNVTRVVRRIAMLHTDIATLVRLTPPAAQTGRAGGSPPTLRLFDGQLVGVEDSATHWQVARDMLDRIVPAPDSDPFVRIWYRATSAYQASQLRWSDAVPNLRQGLTIFPKDAQLLYYSAVMHEVYAAPSYQSLVNVGLMNGYRVGIDAKPDELKKSADLFEQTLALVPVFPDARLHFGHVLGLQDKHEDAARELAASLDGSANPEMTYYGALLLGHEQQELGQSSEARASFERAATLYPSAQSPLLALSQLGRRDGDSPAAQAALARLLKLPPDEKDRPDPWWSFDRSHVRNAGQLLDTMRQTFQLENPR